MLSDPVIEFCGVSKAYSRGIGRHGTLRDDIMALFHHNTAEQKLGKNEFYALRDISFSVPNGKCVGLYGPNGSGKSTLLKLIANVITPNAGQVIINGRIAPLIELGAGFHPDLSGVENIFMNGAILGMRIGEIKSKLDRIVDYSGLGDFISTPVKKYSSGMKLRLGFSVAIHSEADVFLFDEILAVGDEAFQRKSLNSIQTLLDQHRTMLIVSHDKAQLSGLAHEIVHLEKGRLISREQTGQLRQGRILT